MSEFSYLDTMQESDLSWVLGIEQRSYDFPWSLKGFENSLEQGLNYIFYSVDGSRLGYCCVLPVLDEAHLLNICVAPKYRGKGIARAALKALLNKLQESQYQKVLLEVRQSNHWALRLYQSLGFIQEGVRKGYYRAYKGGGFSKNREITREDAILMTYML